MLKWFLKIDSTKKFIQKEGRYFWIHGDADIASL